MDNVADAANLHDPDRLKAVRLPSPAGPWVQFREAWGLEWNRVRLPVPGLPPGLAGLRVLHLSDLHLKRHWSGVYDQFLARLRADPPDLLLVTGDFVDDKRDYRPALPVVRRFVAGLTARLGCFGIPGNHDTYAFAPNLRRSNVTIIENERRLIDTGHGAALELIGLPGVDRRDLKGEFVQSLPPRPGGALRVVLSHFPDHVRRTENLRPDLFLAGHTHGGQVCLPGGRPIIKHDSLPPLLCKGIHRVGPTWLVVNRGFGFSALPVRLVCPAEVIELELEVG